MLQTYQGYFEGGRFINEDSKQIPEHKRTFITVLDEPAERIKKPSFSDEEWNECMRLLDESMDEEVPDFPRANLFGNRKVEI
jgi:hypothetical protein